MELLGPIDDSRSSSSSNSGGVAGGGSDTNANASSYFGQKNGSLHEFVPEVHFPMHVAFRNLGCVVDGVDKPVLHKVSPVQTTYIASD
jgi:hypothetical protein